MELIQRSHANLTRIHRRHLEDRDDVSINHVYIIIPINITPIHWSILVRQNDCDGAISTISHDSLPIPMNITDTEWYMWQYDKIICLNPGLVHHSIGHVSTVKQENAYHCDVCILTVAIIYLYYPSPGNFPWYTLNYPTAATHMRNVIIAVLQTDTPSILNNNHIVTPAATASTPKLLPVPCIPGTPTNIKRTSTQKRPKTSNGAPDIPMLHLLTKIATWNINRQSSYDGPISVCFHGYINLLRIIEPLAFMFIPDSLVAATLTNTAD